MSQHDYVLDNATGAAFRADLNAALQAIVSQNSGTTTPSTTFAGMVWLDTTTNKLKIRDAANAAWLEIYDFSSSNAVSLVAALGSLSACGVRFYNDPNTGLYSTGADAFILAAGGVGYLEISAANGAKVLGTAAVTLPAGTTGQRPTGATGMMRFNSSLSKFEGYNGSLWAGIGGGGGGAGFKWNPISGSGAIESEEYSERVYLFSPSLAQELYASVKIPQSYVSGTQIFVYVSAYSASSSNTMLLKSQSTLIRQATDAFNSTTNQRTSTNSALTNTVSNQLREFILDITDSSGQINSVAVTAGDTVKIRLYRDTDSDTADVRMIANATDIKLS